VLPYCAAQTIQDRQNHFEYIKENRFREVDGRKSGTARQRRGSYAADFDQVSHLLDELHSDGVWLKKHPSLFRSPAVGRTVNVVSGASGALDVIFEGRAHANINWLTHATAQTNDGTTTSKQALYITHVDVAHVALSDGSSFQNWEAPLDSSVKDGLLAVLEIKSNQGVLISKIQGQHQRSALSLFHNAAAGSTSDDYIQHMRALKTSLEKTLKDVKFQEDAVNQLYAFENGLPVDSLWLCYEERFGLWKIYTIMLDKAVLVGLLIILAAVEQFLAAAICAVVVTSISFLSSFCARPYLTPEEDRLDLSARFANLLNAGECAVVRFCLAFFQTHASYHSVVVTLTFSSFF
jgi:hypothetical protein